MIRNWLQSRPLAAFFALTFLISWGGILAVFAANKFDLSPLLSLEGGLMFLAMILGPSVSGIVLTILQKGRQGLFKLLGRALRWRLALRWYAVVLLTIPLILTIILLVLNWFVDPAFAPQFKWPLFVVGLIAASFEEIGWTGFATPQLLERKSIAITGLTLGVTWAGWHLLVDFRYNFGAMKGLWPLEFAIVYLATLTPYRILMTWVYSQTQSLLLAVLMHASYTGWLLILVPIVSATQYIIWSSTLALVLWAVVVTAFTLSPVRNQST
jgi:uncharacterized protein